MKALSLRQPWANAVLYLGKSIENRRWYTRFRGEFLIHAAKYMEPEELEDGLDFCEDVLGLARCYEIEAALGAGDAPTHARHLGGIVGIARIVEVVSPRAEHVNAQLHYPRALLDSGAWRWHMPAQFGFVLADVRPIPFVACRGMPGLFEVDREVLRQVQGYP